MTFFEAPSGNIFSLSPVIYHIHDSNNGSTGFEYVLDVYIWTGDKTADAPNPATDDPNFTLTKLPNSEGYATFDVSYLIRASLTPEEPNSYLLGDTGIVDSGTNHSVWVFVRASYWTDGSTRTASTNSTTYLALRGWTPYSDGVNSTNSSENTFALGVEGQFIPNNVPFGFSVDTSAVDSVDVTASNSDGLNFDFSSADTDLNTQKIQSVVLDAETTKDAGGFYRSRVLLESGTISSTYSDCLEAYIGLPTYITIASKSSGGSTLQSWRLNIACEPKYTPYFIAFLNRYGCWDYLPVTLNSIESASGTRSEYENRYLTTSTTSVSYNATQPIARVYNSLAKKQIVLNTGYQPEEIFEYIQDILQSERHSLVSISELTPLKLTDSQITKQSEVNEKLINYTLTFEYAVEVSNTKTL